MKRDFLNGDHSFKKWFQIMWKNGYIFLFFVFMAVSIVGGFFSEHFGFLPDENWDLFVVGFGLLGMGLIAYKGFYQFWKDLKNGNSR